MNSLNDSPEYYRMREAQEREHAAKAADQVRAIHIVLADKYRELAERSERSEKRRA